MAHQSPTKIKLIIDSEDMVKQYTIGMTYYTGHDYDALAKHLIDAVGDFRARTEPTPETVEIIHN